MSTFYKNLDREKILSTYLDNVYDDINLDVQRVSEPDLQYAGVDLVYENNGEEIYIDEKAQLDYVDKDLPTFTFELSYLKNGKIKRGWLFDNSKKTNYYFLVTGIFATDKNDLRKGFETCKITSINREKLIAHLHANGLTEQKLLSYEFKIRNLAKSGKTPVKEMKPNEGVLYFTTSKSERPINLQLRLQYLLKHQIGKRIYPVG